MRTLISLILLTSLLGLSACVTTAPKPPVEQSTEVKQPVTAPSNLFNSAINQQIPAATINPYRDTPPDPFWHKFMNAQFQEIPAKPDAEAQPEKGNEPTVNLPNKALVETKLVEVEIWSFLLGDEKNNLLRKAQLLGATQLPDPSVWSMWQLASGGVVGANKQTVVFLIPPTLGKFRSGQHIVVELVGPGELNVARYPAL